MRPHQASVIWGWVMGIAGALVAGPLAFLLWYGGKPWVGEFIQGSILLGYGATWVELARLKQKHGEP
jgi:hypothetical protein